MHIKNFGSFINEADATSAQPSAWKVGQSYQMKRDKDNQTYTIKVTNIVNQSNGSINYVVADINGAGTYEGQPLKRPGMELYPTQDGKGLQGNMEMGTFTPAV